MQQTYTLTVIIRPYYSDENAIMRDIYADSVNEAKEKARKAIKELKDRSYRIESFTMSSPGMKPWHG